jgi:hypothetical protein
MYLNAEASINEAFEKGEFKKLMNYLKLNDRILYRVELLMYITFMRPHQEIRLLQVKMRNKLPNGLHAKKYLSLFNPGIIFK